MSCNGTSSQIDPKSESGGGKLRQKSKQSKPSDRLHQGTDSSGFTALVDKKSTLRVEKIGKKLEAVKEKSKKAMLPKRTGVIKSMRRAAQFELYRYAHGKINQVEHENVGTEAAHKTELAGETVVRGVSRFIRQRIRTRPDRIVRKWEKRNTAAKADLRHRKLTQKPEQLQQNTGSRFVKKQRSRRRYQKQARETAKRSAKAAKKAAVTVKKIVVAVVKFIAANPKVLLIICAAILLIAVLQSCMGMVVSVGGGLVGVISNGSYLAEDADIDRAELAHTEWETDLQISINNTETDRPDYDEYHYNVGNIGHNPYALMAFLTAVYGDFTYDSVESVLRDIFNEQYTLTIAEVPETTVGEPGETIGEVRTTGYCACSICCGIYADGITASGTIATANRTIAVDFRNPIVPMGTKVLINGVTYTVEDTGNLTANCTDFDIYFDTHSEALTWGRQTVTAYYADDEAVTSGGRILEINLSVRDFAEILQSRMTAEQIERYDMLLTTKGNRQYLASPFDTNWLPHVSSNYGYRVNPINGTKEYHKGVDIALPMGTEILAGQDGTVIFAGDNGGYGLMVALDDGNELVSKYAHCSQVLVSVGQTVQRGDVIAKVGSTGASTGAHLHLEIIRDGIYLNPIFFALTNDFN